MQKNSLKVGVALTGAMFLSLSCAHAAAPLIERIPLSDTLFAGQTQFSPEESVVLHSLSDFDNYYGNRESLGNGDIDDLRLAAYAFFAQGGKNLHIKSIAGDNPEAYRQALNAVDAGGPVGLLAAPGAAKLGGAKRLAIAATMINRAERDGYGFAVLDTPKGASVEQLLTERQHYSIG